MQRATLPSRGGNVARCIAMVAYTVATVVTDRGVDCSGDYGVGFWLRSGFLRDAHLVEWTHLANFRLGPSPIGDDDL